MSPVTEEPAARLIRYTVANLSGGETLKLSSIAIFPTLAAVLWVAQSGPPAAVVAHANALKDAQSLTIVYSVQKLPGAPEEHKLTYSKPNMYRIETPDSTIVSDGKTTWDYNKVDNTYTENPAGFAKIAEDEYWAWCAFFIDQFKDVSGAKAGTKRSIKGNPVQEVVISFKAGVNKDSTLYIDAKTGVARGASIKTERSEQLIIAKEITLGKDALSASEFTFTPPAGAKKAEKPKVEAVSYDKVDAIFQSSCMPCHSGGDRKGGLDLTNYNGTMSGGRHGAVVVPNDSANSSLVMYIRGQRTPRMPKDAGALSSKDTQTISNWIDSGAK